MERKRQSKDKSGLECLSRRPLDLFGSEKLPGHLRYDPESRLSDSHDSSVGPVAFKSRNS